MSAKRSDEKRVAITIRFPPALHAKLKVLAHNRNMDMGEYCRIALEVEIQNAKRFDSIHQEKRSTNQPRQSSRSDPKTGWYAVSDDNPVHP